MVIRSWSEDVILVDLPGELEEHDEPQTGIETVRDTGDRNVVVDFSNVDTLGSAILAELSELRKLAGISLAILLVCFAYLCNPPGARATIRVVAYNTSNNPDDATAVSSQRSETNPLMASPNDRTFSPCRRQIQTHQPASLTY